MAESFLAAVTGMLVLVAAPGESYLVMESRGTAAARMPSGTVVARGESFELSAGGEVVLLSETGELRTIRGPVRALPPMPSDTAPKPGALKALASILMGERSGQRAPLVVRGPGETAATDPWVVDLTSSGVKCVFDGVPTMLWRSGTLPLVRASLEAVRGGDKQFFNWPAGAQVVPWPARVPMTAGETYLFSTGTVDARRFDLAVAPGKPSAGSALLFMAESGCQEQLALVRADVAKSK